MKNYLEIFYVVSSELKHRTYLCHAATHKYCFLNGVATYMFVCLNMSRKAVFS